jgi:transcriptional regulator with XRE-family HTH domain
MSETQPQADSPFRELKTQLSQARLAAGKTFKQCADLLGVSTKKYQRIENGDNIPSLPELEVLAYFLGVLPQVFLGTQTFEVIKKEIDEEQLRQLIQVHQRILSTTLQVTRSKKNLTLKDLSKQTNIPTARLKRYETTSVAIPLNELDAISKVLEIPMQNLFDQSGFLAQWQNEQKRVRTFLELSETLQEFVTADENRVYLNVAEWMKAAGVENLEGLADGLKELVNKAKT